MKFYHELNQKQKSIYDSIRERLISLSRKEVLEILKLIEYVYANDGSKP